MRQTRLQPIHLTDDHYIVSPPGTTDAFLVHVSDDARIEGKLPAHHAENQEKGVISRLPSNLQRVLVGAVPTHTDFFGITRPTTQTIRDYLARAINERGIDAFADKRVIRWERAKR